MRCASGVKSFTTGLQSMSGQPASLCKDLRLAVGFELLELGLGEEFHVRLRLMPGEIAR